MNNFLLNNKTDKLQMINKVVNRINNEINYFFENNHNLENILNIKGTWGTGKTTVVTHLEENFNQKFNNKNVKFYTINLWEYETVLNPYNTLIKDILNKIIKTDDLNLEEPDKSKNKIIAKWYANISWQIPLISLLGIKAIIGTDIKSNEEKNQDEIKNNKFLDQLNDEAIKELKNYIEQENLKIVFIFDEIDRCTLENQIKFLSYIKNIFHKITNIYFIVSCNNDYIDSNLSLNNNLESYTCKLFSKTIDLNLIIPTHKAIFSDNDLINSFIKEIYNNGKVTLSPREINDWLNRVNIIFCKLEKENKKNLTLNGEEFNVYKKIKNKIEFVIFFCLYIKFKEKDYYHEVLSSEINNFYTLESLNLFFNFLKNKFLSYGTSLNSLDESPARLKNSLKELDMEVNPLTYRQLLGFSAILPKPNDPLIFNNGREMPCWTLASSFPLLNGGLNDYKGLYLGENTTNDAMLFDQFMLNDKRKNHNQIIIGTSGSGKSTLTKKEIAFYLNMGRTVIVIDPEREYRNLCNYYKGQWIDTGNATIGRINPLQVLDNNFKELDEATTENFDEINEAPVSNHLRTLTQWFRTLYHDLKERELRVLINEIQKTYTKFQITNATDISELKPGQFPTFQNLYETICHSYQEKLNKTLNELMDIIQYDFCNDGQYSKLWNGHTTLNFNNQFVVYDVWTLFDQDIPKITAAQLYLILAFIKGEVKRNRFKKDKELIIVIDEAHLAIDKDNPVALNFMYQMVKRCRKYNAGIIITTQNINDFTGTEDIKKKTTAMINNTQYTFIFNLAQSDLNDVKLLYQSYGGLSPEENDFIQRAGKGDTLMIVHSYERYCLTINILNSEFKAFDNN